MIRWLDGYRIVAVVTYLEVVCVFPHIHSEHRHVRPVHGVLVLSGGDLETTIGTASADEPAPATALDTEKGSAKGIDKGLLGAPAGSNRALQRWGRAGQVVSGSSGRSQVLPEEGVVDVATAVETDLLLQADQGGNIARLSGRGLGGEGGIEIVNVGLVMLLMVQLHDLLGDHGLEGLEM